MSYPDVKNVCEIFVFSSLDINETTDIRLHHIQCENLNSWSSLSFGFNFFCCHQEEERSMQARVKLSPPHLTLLTRKSAVFKNAYTKVRQKAKGQQFREVLPEKFYCLFALGILMSIHSK